MHKRLLLVALAVVALSVALVSQAGADKEKVKENPEKPALPNGCNHLVTAKQSRGFTKAVWSESLWKRGKPKASTVKAYRNKLKCAAGPGHRKAMKAYWRSEKKEFYRFRGRELFRVNITPFQCNGSWWATPCEIPLHESGYCTGGTNCYGMLDAWYVHGCTEFAPSGFGAPMRAQHICAHRHYATYGRGGWPSY